jgi:phage terminase large subunit-like protein
VTAYADAVVAGRIVAGPHVRGACERHLADLQRQDLIWNQPAAMRAIGFFRDELYLNGGQFEGQPFELQAWQKFCVGSLFGWYRPNGLRRFRLAYIETGKGSGKSPMAAGIGIYALMADGEERAQVYVAAKDKNQAMVCFEDVVAMYQLSPELKRRLLPKGKSAITQLTYLKKHSFIRPISSEEASSGPRPSCSIIDEIHEHPDDSTISMLIKGTKWRRNPLTIMITNSGKDRTSVAWRYHELGVQICAGEKRNDEQFFYICALDEGDVPEGGFPPREVWPKANPSIGVIIQEDYVEGLIRDAQNVPANRNEVLRLTFCVWTDEEGAWIDKAVWGACRHPFEPEDFAGRRAWAAVDLSRRFDMTAMSVVIEDGTMVVERETDEGRVNSVEPCFLAFTEFWMPEDSIRKRQQEDNKPYLTWVEQEHLTLTPGATTKLSFVADRMAWVDQIFILEAIAYDKYRFEELQDELDGANVDVPAVEHPQGFRRSPDSGLYMPNSLEQLEELVVERRLKVRPNPILNWNVASMGFRRDAQDNRMPSKLKSRGRIDGAVSLIQAAGLALNAPEKQTPSVYAGRGVLVL